MDLTSKQKITIGASVAVLFGAVAVAIWKAEQPEPIHSEAIVSLAFSDAEKGVEEKRIEKEEANKKDVEDKKTKESEDKAELNENARILADECKNDARDTAATIALLEQDFAEINKTLTSRGKPTVEFVVTPFAGYKCTDYAKDLAFISYGSAVKPKASRLMIFRYSVADDSALTEPSREGGQATRTNDLRKTIGRRAILKTIVLNAGLK